jgi:hypothetical protein
LTGTVRDAAGNTDAAAAVLLFTAERELWALRTVRCIRSLRASEKGVYSVRGVQPGDYYLVAIPDADMGDYPDPRMLDSLTHLATRIAMGPSERKTQDLGRENDQSSGPHEIAPAPARADSAPRSLSWPALTWSGQVRDAGATAPTASHPGPPPSLALSSMACPVPRCDA